MGRDLEVRGEGEIRSVNVKETLSKISLLQLSMAKASFERVSGMSALRHCSANCAASNDKKSSNSMNFYSLGDF